MRSAIFLFPLLYTVFPSVIFNSVRNPFFCSRYCSKMFVLYDKAFGSFTINICSYIEYCFRFPNAYCSTCWAGQRQYCRDNVTKFSGHKVVCYCNITIFFVPTPSRHRDLNIFRFFSGHWGSVTLSEAVKLSRAHCPVPQLFLHVSANMKELLVLWRQQNEPNTYYYYH